MLRVFISGGVLMYPIVLIALVLAGLTVSTAVELGRRHGANAAVVQNGLDGLLFWGLFALMLGVLGQLNAYYLSMTAVVNSGLVSPRAVWLGLSEAFISPMAGLIVLTFAGLAWYALRFWHVRCRPGARRP